MVNRYVAIVFEGERNINRAGTYFVPGKELFRTTPIEEGLMFYGVFAKLCELGPDLIKQAWRVDADGALEEDCTDITRRRVREAKMLFRMCD